MQWRRMGVVQTKMASQERRNVNTILQACTILIKYVANDRFFLLIVLVPFLFIFLSRFGPGWRYAAIGSVVFILLDLLL